LKWLIAFGNGLNVQTAGTAVLLLFDCVDFRCEDRRVGSGVGLRDRSPECGNTAAKGDSLSQSLMVDPNHVLLRVVEGVDEQQKPGGVGFLDQSHVTDHDNVIRVFGTLLFMILDFVTRRFRHERTLFRRDQNSSEQAADESPVIGDCISSAGPDRFSIDAVRCQVGNDERRLRIGRIGAKARIKLFANVAQPFVQAPGNVGSFGQFQAIELPHLARGLVNLIAEMDRRISSRRLERSNLPSGKRREVGSFGREARFLAVRLIFRLAGDRGSRRRYGVVATRRRMAKEDSQKSTENANGDSNKIGEL